MTPAMIWHHLANNMLLWQTLSKMVTGHILVKTTVTFTVPNIIMTSKNEDYFGIEQL